MMLYTTEYEYVVLDVFQRCVSDGVSDDIYQDTLYMKHRGKFVSGFENETTSYQDDTLLEYLFHLGFSKCYKEDVIAKVALLI